MEFDTVGPNDGFAFAIPESTMTTRVNFLPEVDMENVQTNIPPVPFGNYSAVMAFELSLDDTLIMSYETDPDPTTFSCNMCPFECVKTARFRRHLEVHRRNER